ncbi:survival motor neuron protein-like isoform X2 [Gymnodraco acuticeps]|uniref:Survival motor neuron protein-like isoform X2 n=1 Tax=Gymnodraco acuticeps TaxID=8218 RepID=A0A6P8TGG5_GYMAC|nr:survival motor neuron protein-like isoform X2 [Gymnodraco acuticeps]
MAAIKEEASLVEAFENNFEISQGVKPAASAASEETESREKHDDDEDDRQQDEEKESPPEGQPTVGPPAAEPSSTETKWALGAACRAEWSEDRTVYPAIVVSLDGERCRVRFNDYGNYKDLALSELKAPDDAPQTPIQNCLKPPLDEEDHWIESKALDWKPGSRCRAVYSEDSMFYPAVVLWVKGERCCVRFDGYENEEEQEVSALLSLGALHGNSMGAAAKLKEKASNNHQSKVEKESEEKQNDETQTPPNMFSFFPPFAPPPPGSWDSVSFIPPPPPLWTFGSSAGTDASSSMLMLWYMCGFHTGSYMAQQAFNSNSTD